MSLSIRFSGFEQKLFWGKHPFVAHIFEGEGLPPAGFNVLCISIDVSECSLLNWQKEILLAREAVNQNLRILWDLQFHLSRGSLEDEARFLTFQLNVDHFNETIWKVFKEASLGVSLYRGSLQEGELDYLKSLAALLDSESSCFLFIDASAASDFERYLQLVPFASLGPFFPILKGEFAEKYPWAFPALSWGSGFSPLGYCAHALQSCAKEMPVQTALCLPETYPAGRIEAVLQQMGPLPFRVIPESLLTQEWEGIDRLFVLPELLNEKLRRKLQGFMAAGGVVVETPLI